MRFSIHDRSYDTSALVPLRTSDFPLVYATPDHDLFFLLSYEPGTGVSVRDAGRDEVARYARSAGDAPLLCAVGGSLADPAPPADAARAAPVPGCGPAGERSSTARMSVEIYGRYGSAIGPDFERRCQTFLAEYRALCERHRLTVAYDGGYPAHELTDLDHLANGPMFGGLPNEWQFCEVAR